MLGNMDKLPFDELFDKMSEMHVYFGARNRQLGKPEPQPEPRYKVV